MPQLQSTVLKDRASPVVDHTFLPRNIAGNVGELVETQGVPVGESRLTISLRKTPQGRYKAVLKLAIPVVVAQVVNGVSTPVIARTAYVDVSTDFAATSSFDERNDAIGMIQSALASTNPLVNGVLVNLEGVY